MKKINFLIFILFAMFFTIFFNCTSTPIEEATSEIINTATEMGFIETYISSYKSYFSNILAKWSIKGTLAIATIIAWQYGPKALKMLKISKMIKAVKK